MFRFTPYALAFACLAAGCGQSHPADPVVWGRELYGRNLCGQCHGPERQGTIQGPPLGDLTAFWTREKLAAYLASPMSFVDTTPHLRALADHYKVLMPAMPLSNEERDAVSAFLLDNQPEEMPR